MSEHDFQTRHIETMLIQQVSELNAKMGMLMAAEVDSSRRLDRVLDDLAARLYRLDGLPKEVSALAADAEGVQARVKKLEAAHDRLLYVGFGVTALAALAWELSGDAIKGWFQK